jgi:cobalt transporter subunit CbtB
VTAPATVSGEVLEIIPLGNWEGASRSTTRKSGDLPDKMGVSDPTAHPAKVLHFCDKDLPLIEAGLTEGDMTTTTLATSVAISQRMIAGFVCLFIGASAIFLVGLSDMSVAHNAAHDTRHAIGFPCH